MEKAVRNLLASLLRVGARISYSASMVCVVAGAVLWLTSTRATAESARLNLHGDLGLGLPIAGSLAPWGANGEDPIGVAGWAALDWQFAAPFAAEIILGGGRVFDQSKVNDNNGFNYFHFGVGGRVRFLDDKRGYHNERGGNWLGNLWLSGHLGYHDFDGSQFGLDVAVGYELSVHRPLQVGPFLRMAFLPSGNTSPMSIFFLAGVSVSVELIPMDDHDADRDGLGDEREARLGTDPRRRDTDNDGIGDQEEVLAGYNPLERDTDGDGIGDGEEDYDHDGKLDDGETDPRVKDTDRGGVPDLDEVQDPLLDPRNPRDDDSDQDGVASNIDRCSETPEGTDTDQSGCPVLKPVMELPGIQFATGSAELTPEAQTELEKALRILTANPNDQVEIAGHTDNAGRPGHNRMLSRRRAEAVRKWLIAHGIAARRLTAKGYGSEEPVAPNDTEVGRATNRRIELRKKK